MSALDWLLLAILGASALTGLLRGFIGVIASVAAWLLGGWAAFAFGGGVARLVGEGATPTPLALLVGYGACFVVVSMIVALVAWLLRRALAAAGLGGVDRALGFALGGVRGIALACVVVLLLGFTAVPRQRHWQASALVPLLKPGALWLSTWLPATARAHLDLDGHAPVRNLPAAPRFPGLPA